MGDDGPKDPPLGEEGAVRLLSEAMPELRWSSLRYVDAGWDHEVLLLDDRLTVRFPNEEHYRRMLDAERVVIDRLAGRSRVALPRVRAIDPDRRFSVHDFVPGEQLTPARLLALSAPDRDEVADALAGLLSALHGLDPSVLPPGTPSWTVPEEHVEVRRLAASGLPALLGPVELRLVDEVLDDVPALLAESPPPVLVHGDVYEDHLLHDPATGRLGLIDFSDLAVGDPAIDFAELIDYGRPFLEDVVRRYGGDEALTDRAIRYGRWLAVYLMTDHLVSAKTSFAEARIPFDRRVGSDG
ncbi:MAG TPA: aminoglycoside phosphotransferase family protein [Amnibacterium sp.]|jgi:aminoglycoside 2''-phosphotransferase|uniref:phosphotransferase family protein n=1 Tax=Amnibacterium sp. TaxID=1872496 RepID=UPI002F940713